MIKINRQAAVIGLVATAAVQDSYLATYSVLSILVFGWLIVATGRAPYLPLWQAAPWQAWIPNIVMPFVCLLLAYGMVAFNPLSIASVQPTILSARVLLVARAALYFGQRRFGRQRMSYRMAILPMSLCFACSPRSALSAH